MEDTPPKDTTSSNSTEKRESLANIVFLISDSIRKGYWEIDDLIWEPLPNNVEVSQFNLLYRHIGKPS